MRCCGDSLRSHSRSIHRPRLCGILHRLPSAYFPNPVANLVGVGLGLPRNLVGRSISGNLARIRFAHRLTPQVHSLGPDSASRRPLAGDGGLRDLSRICRFLADAAGNHFSARMGSFNSSCQRLLGLHGRLVGTHCFVREWITRRHRPMHLGLSKAIAVLSGYQIRRKVGNC